MKVCSHCGVACHDENRFCHGCGSAFAESSGDPLVGQTIGGAYVLQELVGVGGMGRVYRAEQRVLGRTVALKVIHPQLLSDEQTVARFYTEARAASRLNHPNSVSVIDFGRNEDGVLYLVMEYVTGNDLATVMYERGPLPFARIIEVLEGVLAGLGEAHALDVVHRDLKPENVILKPLRSGGDLIKVVDFGLATMLGGGSTSVTGAGFVCGTPDYMSPEQGRGDPVDGRTDLYALGVVLFELLTDRLPFVDDTPTKLILRHMHDPVPDPREVASARSIPASLAEVTMHALAKDPESRYQSAEEMAAALREAARTLEADAPKPGVRCGTCGAKNAAGMRFCGSCGVRLSASMTLPISMRSIPPRVSSVAPGPTDRPLVARDQDLAELLGLAEASGEEGSTQWVHLAGESGVGKTRMLRELALCLEEAGDVVAFGMAHPLSSLVPYWPLRQVLASLLEVEPDALEELANRAAEILPDPLARAGVAEIAHPRGLDGLGVQARTGAAVAALAAAAKHASKTRSARKHVAIVVDDLHRCDPLTLSALEQLSDWQLPECVILTAAVGEQPKAKVSWRLTGIPSQSTDRFLFGATHSSPPPSRPVMTLPPLGEEEPTHLPLYLEQVQSLGADVGQDEEIPRRLADVVSMRTDKLDVSSRRVLQAAAVLGQQGRLSDLRNLAGEKDFLGLGELEAQQLVRVLGRDGGEPSEANFEFVHPLIRDLVEAAIPAEARRVLHQQAFQLASQRGEGLEVRSEHAYRSGDAMLALMMLERTGDQALARGDAQAAVVSFGRALEVARREALEAGQSIMDHAMITFSRKLGTALQRCGEVAGADGVIREVLDVTPRQSMERARLLVLLGTIAVQRERYREAQRFLGHAVDVMALRAAPDTEVALHLAWGQLHQSREAWQQAADAYGRALEAMGSKASPSARRIAIALEQAWAQLRAGELTQAASLAEQAKQWADHASSAHLIAKADALLGEVALRRGSQDGAAVERFRDAARWSAEAGDAPSHQHCKERALHLEQS